MLQCIPSELLNIISSYLDAKSFLNLKQTCKQTSRCCQLKQKQVDELLESRRVYNNPELLEAICSVNTLNLKQIDLHELFKKVSDAKKLQSILECILKNQHGPFLGPFYIASRKAHLAMVHALLNEQNVDSSVFDKYAIQWAYLELTRLMN